MTGVDGDTSHVTSSFDGTYGPGSMLGDRYRIIALIGRGGMGEVYMAEDLTLGQRVALKFLPGTEDEQAQSLPRFRQEVRIAREVTHGNVARVHDIGAADGRHFISMEHVDGEDLSRLLKRIGRIPGEKAEEIARQICAGLAAAHQRGVVHRDLKPANVMLDAEGRVKLTDFGLAAFSAEGDDQGGLSGTPAYMSPEQLQGREVDVRSEVYSLGLVLYELFTGKRAHGGRSFAELRRQLLEESPSSPSSHVSDIDPAVERVIMRCLEKDPADRPASVRAVALALPGGDPLAAALAAGEVPAPELVARAGARGGLSVGAAAAWLGGFLVLLAVTLSLAGEAWLINMVPLDSSPEVLSRKARDLLASLGLEDEPADRVLQFHADADYLAWLGEQEGPDRWEPVRASRPAALLFLYREAPIPLIWQNQRDLTVNRVNDPPFVVPGMARVWLDTVGRLHSLSIVPQTHGSPNDPPPEPVDWTPLFEASGLDTEAFEPTEPSWRPDVSTDERFAWRGTDASTGEPMLVEAGTADGRVVSWRTAWPWEERELGMSARSSGRTSTVTVVAAIAGFIALLVGAIVLARRNLALGRGDRKGAFRISVAVVIFYMLARGLGSDHTATVLDIGTLFESLSRSIAMAMLVWVFYLAIEPFVRRVSPRRIVSWLRLLDGRLSDPLVGRDVLAGAVFALGLVVTDQLQVVLPRWLGAASPGPAFEPGATFGLLGGLRHLSLLPAAAASSLVSALLLVVAFVLLRLALRREALAAAALLIILVVLGSVDSWESGLMTGLRGGLLIYALLRFGVLTLAVSFMVGRIISNVPLSFDASSWFISQSVFTVLLLVVLAAWAFRVSLAGRTLLPEAEGP